MTRENDNRCEMPQGEGGQGSICEPGQPAGAGSERRSATRFSRLTTQLANERTFLAWIRTGIALLAFGFVVEKAGTFLEAISTEVSQKQHNFVRYSGIAGVILMLSGAFIIGIATLRFWFIDRSIRRGECETSILLDIIIAVAITVVALTFIAFLVFQSSLFA